MEPTRRRRGSLRRALLLAAALPSGVGLGACATSKPAEIDPRFVAVHNTLTAMGLAQVGPVQQGSLVEGREARLPIELVAQCATVVTMGGEGVYDVDAQLLDPRGNPVARDASHEPQAVLRACVETPGTYTLVVKMSAGSGQFLTAMWSGGVTSGGAASGPSAALLAGNGTCEAPIVVGPGEYSGNTSRGEASNEGSCTQSRSKEIVYRLEVPTQKRLVVETETAFDGVLYMRKEECDSQDAEVEGACNDDADNGNARASKFDVVVDPGTYYIFVDGYDNNTGAFKLHVTMADVPTIADVCRNARALPIGSTLNGSTSGSFDLGHASCGDEAKGKDSIYHFDLAQRSRVRIVEHSSDFSPVVYVRRTCSDEQSEVACSDVSGADEEAAFVSVLDPGSYAVFADTKDQTEGRFTLAAETAPELGSGVQGDGCADAELLNHSDPAVSGDTFFAKDDIAGRCAGQGAADVVYRVDLARKSRVTASMNQQDGDHTFVLQKTCGDRATELSCDKSIDKLLPAGTYYLAVDGSSPDNFGKYTFDFSIKDVGAQENACKAAPALVDGQTVTSSTAGVGHKFPVSCGGSESAQGSGDKEYKLTLATRTHVSLNLSTPSWDGVLAIRKTCVDAEGVTYVGASEAGCNRNYSDSHHAMLDRTLDPGTYYVVVGGHMTGNEGAFTLTYRALK